MARNFFGKTDVKLGGNGLFGEQIERKSTRPRTQAQLVARPRWLLGLLILIVCGLFGLARLADLQILRGSYFRVLSDGNRIRRIPIRAPRGEILDRNGYALARNVPVYKLAEFSSGGVVVSTAEISREEALKIQAGNGEEGSRLLVDIAREYPLGEAGAHLIGYTGEASSEEIGLASSEKCKVGMVLLLGDLVGRMGIEQYYDCILRGVNGEELIEVDTRGRIVRRLGRREPIPGESVKLYVDSNLQKAVYEALLAAPELSKSVGGTDWTGEVVRGAVVAQDPSNGGILALVSVPSFDPGKIREDYGKLREDKNLLLFNRAIGGAYHPGSTFKIVTAAAGFEDGKIDENFTYIDMGVVTVNNFSYKNWYFTQYGRTEGIVDTVRALARSTDTFFYKVGELVGAERLAFWARKFGYGEKSGVDLPGEVAGLAPDPEWKLKTKGERWFLGNTYHMAIGQGDVAATPLQVNLMTTVVANGGRRCRPKVLQISQVSQECEDTEVGEKTLNEIREGMKGACTTGGTAFTFFELNAGLPAGRQVFCKTGTAQTVGENTHAWLTVFSGDIVLTVLVEEGGEGSRVAGPVASQIMRGWISTRFDSTD